MKKIASIELYLINVIDVASYERKRETSNFDLRHISKNLPITTQNVRTIYSCTTTFLAEDSDNNLPQCLN